jgi:hypothetical protein
MGPARHEGFDRPELAHRTSMCGLSTRSTASTDATTGLHLPWEINMFIATILIILVVAVGSASYARRQKS